MFLKDSNGRRIGCVMVDVTSVGLCTSQKVRWSLSSVHDSDKFDREVARDLCRERLNFGHRLSGEATMYNIVDGTDFNISLLKAVSRHSEVPTKVKRSIRQWLKRF